MKKSISVILGVSFVGISGYFYFFTEKSIVETAVIDKVYLESDSVKNNTMDRGDTEFNALAPEQKDVPETNELTQKISHAELQKMTQAAVMHRKKIDDLILQFDTNLSDPVARKNIKKEIDTRMVGYNEAVLPVAMKAMKNRSSSEYKD